jgi:plasmid stabilization system protein ParE
MIHQLIIQALAEADMTQAALWYDSRRPGLGDEFLADIQASLERAAANPRHFPCLRRKPDVRRVLAGRFPYRIFFVLRPEAIVVFRVLHGARHDREWKGNIPGE